ncbi:MAG: hypothetical protein D8G53_15035 [Candidatus Saccharimonas sp.]|nr:MAG: hypothetical protein D8G53_15035 [Candidatus Saccharimonas sp.]
MQLLALEVAKYILRRILAGKLSSRFIADKNTTFVSLQKFSQIRCRRDGGINLDISGRATGLS